MGCEAPIAAPIYTGRDNVIRLVLINGGEVLADLSPVTRVTIDLDGGTTVIDSDVVGGSVIWWTDSEDYRGQTTDVLSLQLGDQGIAAGAYSDVVIVVYDAIYTNGLRLENDIKLTVQ